MNLYFNPARYRSSPPLCFNGEFETMVDLAQDHELGFWTDRLGCSAEKLLAAVESVGPGVEDVTAYLRAGW